MQIFESLVALPAVALVSLLALLLLSLLLVLLEGSSVSSSRWHPLWCLHTHASSLVGALVLHQCGLEMVKFLRGLQLLILKELDFFLILRLPRIDQVLLSTMVDHFVAFHLILDLLDHLKELLWVV